jgi:hypothetical protein
VAVSAAKVLLFGLVGLIVGELVTLWQDGASPLLSAALSVLAGSIPLIGEYLKNDGGDRSERTPAGNARGAGRMPPQPPVRHPGPRLGVLVGWLVGLVLVVGGAAYGISYGIGYVTGDERVVEDRLAAPASGRAGPLTISIESVGVTDHYTKVTLTAVNTSDTPLTIPLFGNCQLIDEFGTSLTPKMSIGTGEPISVPTGGIPIRRTIVFDGRPAPGASTLTVSISTLFWQGPGGPRSLQVTDIGLVSTRP